jgi:hypothetical protein
VRQSERKFVVFTSLVAVLTLTSALLLALAPAPLSPELGMIAIDSPRSLDVVFETDRPTTDGRWQYLYIHHSKTRSGSASTLGAPDGSGLGDHFLIGNGDGVEDGHLQISHRWLTQQPALPPGGAAEINVGAISICVVGDFDTALPSSQQMKRLTQLVTALQDRLNIPRDRVLLATDVPNTPAGAGRYFPATAFRQAILP